MPRFGPLLGIGACLFWAMACSPLVAQETVREIKPSLPRGTPPDYAGTDVPNSVTQFTEALQRAYWTKPGLLAERARLRGTDYRVPAARALFGPTITYEATYGYQRDNAEDLTGRFFARSGWSSTASAILSQPVFTFGRLASQEKIALAEVAFGRAALGFVEQQVLLDAATAYAAVIRERNGVNIAADYLATLERELADNRARLRVREVTATDVQQVETRVELGRAQLLAARRSAASSEAQFISVIGAPAGELAQPNPLVIPAQGLDEAYATAEMNNPLIAAAHAREKISRAQQDAARSEMLPRVDLRGRADYGTVTPYSDRLRQTELRAEVVVSGPLFDSGLRLSRLSEARAFNDADWRLIDDALRENRLQVADAWNEWVTQSASISRLQAAIDAAQAAYDGALLQERAGLRTTLDVLDLARDLLSARSSYNAASAAAFTAQARLLQAMGQLEHDYLFPDGSGYDPASHYKHVEDRGGFPLVSSVLRAVDAIPTGSRADRPLRDPAAPLTAPAASISMPVEAQPMQP